MNRSNLFAAAAVAAVLGIGSIASAQSYLSAASKMRGIYSESATIRGMNNVRGYASDYQQYADSVHTVEPEVAQDASDSIGNYIAKARRHFAWMRSVATKAGDKETLKGIDNLEKNLDVAAAAHRKLHDLTRGQQVDKAESLKYTKQIDDSIAKVIADHDKLMDRFSRDEREVSAQDREDL